MADEAVRHIKSIDLEGDYFEFGVFRGSTFSCFYHLFKKYASERTMWAYDSFKGLPPLTKDDSWTTDTVEGSSSWSEGQYSCGIDEFLRFMKWWNVPESYIKIVPGFFKDSLKNHDPSVKAAIIWVDCDLYSSTVSVLNFSKTLLQEGTMVLFDDFGGRDVRGERRALKEFLDLNPDIEFVPYMKFHTKGAAFLVFKKGQQASISEGNPHYDLLPTK